MNYVQRHRTRLHLTEKVKSSSLCLFINFLKYSASNNAFILNKDKFQWDIVLGHWFTFDILS